MRLSARDWLPPALFRWLRLRRRDGIHYEGNYADWNQASTNSSGYDAKEILTRVLASTLMVERGEAAFERDSVTFEQAEYMWPSLACLMAAAARHRGKLEVLDFGGALGSRFFQHRHFLDALPEVQWNIIEQEHYVAAGKSHLQNTRLRFHADIATCLEDCSPSVVLLSSVLQYLESPAEILARLLLIDADFLVIDRTPFSNLAHDRLLVQVVPKEIYAASYPMWVFSLSTFMCKLPAEWRLIASHASQEGAARSRQGLEFEFRDLILERQR